MAITPFGSAPALTSVTYSNNGTTLAFNPPTLSSGLTVTSYDYEVSLDAGSTVHARPYLSSAVG